MPIAEKTSVIVGASGGIGAALAESLAVRGKVVRLSRSDGTIEITDETSIEQAANSIQKSGVQPDMIIVASGILHRGDNWPEKSMAELGADWLLENYLVNAIGPALVAKHFLPLMPRKQRCVFAVLSARVGSISDNRLGGWHGYRASKAALNMFIRGISIEWQRRNPQMIVVGMHPGTVKTALSAPFGNSSSSGAVVCAKDAATDLLNVMDGLKPEDSGQLFGYDGNVIQP